MADQKAFIETRLGQPSPLPDDLLAEIAAKASAAGQDPATYLRNAVTTYERDVQRRKRRSAAKASKKAARDQLKPAPNTSFTEEYRAGIKARHQRALREAGDARPLGATTRPIAKKY